MISEETLAWILDSDPSVQYQVHRDLLGNDRVDIQEKISKEGWGTEFLSRQNFDKHWGQKFYQPKWTSTHYTLLDLRNLCISPNTIQAKSIIDHILDTEKAEDGGIKPIGESGKSDVCINGMFLNYASYFKADEEKLKSVINCLMDEVMPDGGYNCRSSRSKCMHSSLHSTISVLEGLSCYEKNNYTYRIGDVRKAKNSSIEFLLIHKLYLSDRSGEIINNDFLKLSYPSRWRYDILRALDYLQYEGIEGDVRLKPALKILLKKRNRSGTWNVQAKHPGVTHFDMEKAGKSSCWNTLRALRVLKHFDDLI